MVWFYLSLFWDSCMLLNCINSSLLFIAEWYSLVRIYHNLFIYSPVDVLATANKALMNIHFNFSWVNIEEWNVLLFKKLLICFPNWLYHFAFPLAINVSCSCSKSFQLLVCHLSILSILEYKVIPHCFNFYFSNDIENLFMR